MINKFVFAVHVWHFQLLEQHSIWKGVQHTFEPKREIIMNCGTVNTTKTTTSDSDESESDGSVDDEELLLAMKMSMAPTSPKPSESTAFVE